MLCFESSWKRKIGAKSKKKKNFCQVWAGERQACGKDFVLSYFPSYEGKNLAYFNSSTQHTL
jgi:hypothetical protein